MLFSFKKRGDMTVDHSLKTNWSREEIKQLFDLPFMDLLHQAHSVHRTHFPKLDVQLSTLENIKKGGCPEDCNFCGQSVSAKDGGIKAEKLMSCDNVLESAKRAKENGATRYCMAAAWTGLKERDEDAICEIIKSVKSLGLETCMTLGQVTRQQCDKLKEAGLDYYNHNIETSEENYGKIVTTHKFSDRVQTVLNVREAGINVCCGVLLGMGESLDDHISMLMTLSNFAPHPESVPINALVRIKGTTQGDNDPVDAIAFVKMVAVARIMMPKSRIRLSGGRLEFSESLHALAFYAGANSIHYASEKLLVTDNRAVNDDKILFEKLKMSVS